MSASFVITLDTTGPEFTLGFPAQENDVLTVPYAVDEDHFNTEATLTLARDVMPMTVTSNALLADLPPNLAEQNGDVEIASTDDVGNVSVRNYVVLIQGATAELAAKFMQDPEMETAFFLDPKLDVHVVDDPRVGDIEIEIDEGDPNV